MSPAKFLAAVYVAHPEVEAWDFRPRHAERLMVLCPEIRCRVCSNREAFGRLLPEAEIILAWRVFQDEVDRAPGLRILATPAAGRDYFDVRPPERTACFYGRFHGQIMAETALAMMLGMTRGLLPAVTTLAHCPWPRAELAGRMRLLRGSHVCVLGFGHIGQWIGRLLKPFGVRLTGIRRNPAASPPPSFMGPADAVRAAADLDEVLPTVDHLVIVLPGGSERDAIIDARRLALLPPHATLLNLGRGNAVEEEALCRALRRNELAGVCLDVFQHEPLPPDSPLRSCPNLWRLPHASAIAPEYLDLFVEDFAEQFHEWMKTCDA